jgi:3-deoxy-D-manno-octulosonic acid kinase
MTNSGQRVATSTGVMLADPTLLVRQPQGIPESLFDPNYWALRGELKPATGGRGSAWFVGSASEQWVLRHYRRGGRVAPLFRDLYLWSGENRVRAFAEWRLLAHLAQLGLPVPRPVAAWYRRVGPTYRCDLITQRILDTQPLSAVLKSTALADPAWRAIGTAVASLHRAGADHPDLTAHNILLDSKQSVSVVDFDRGRLRAAGSWSSRNVRRLHRSLAKVSRSLPSGRFTETAWDSFLAGYQAG